jgi:hypothetical protein
MRRVLLVGLLAIALLVAMAGQALAFHCYNPDKKPGAGAVTEDDIKPAGNSGKLVAPGAFLEEEEGVEVFIRGGLFHEEAREEGIVGLGSIPSQAHDNGSPDHGVLALSE